MRFAFPWWTMLCQRSILMWQRERLIERSWWYPSTLVFLALFVAVAPLSADGLVVFGVMALYVSLMRRHFPGGDAALIMARKGMVFVAPPAVLLMLLSIVGAGVYDLPIVSTGTVFVNRLVQAWFVATVVVIALRHERFARQRFFQEWARLLKVVHTFHGVDPSLLPQRAQRLLALHVLQKDEQRRHEQRVLRGVAQSASPALPLPSAPRSRL